MEVAVGDEVQDARADDAPHDHPQVGVEDALVVHAEAARLAHGQDHGQAEADGQEREVGGEADFTDERRVKGEEDGAHQPLARRRRAAAFGLGRAGVDERPMMPTTSAASAMLKVSHSCVPIFQTTKSVTRPKATRSMALPSAPPTMSPSSAATRVGRRSCGALQVDEGADGDAERDGHEEEVRAGDDRATGRTPRPDSPSSGTPR